jgi:hypothetical protein
MDDEQKRWSEQYDRNFSEKEFLRYGCVLMSFLLVGITLGMTLHNAGIIVLFVVVFHAIIWLAPYWQPAYAIVRKIMGNPNIPSQLPIHQRKWWLYIPIAVRIFILLIALRLGIQLLAK